MKVLDIAQYSPEWFAARRGVPTASEFSSIITAKKQELAAGHKSYICRLIGDRFDVEYPRLNDNASAAMKRGSAMEPAARRFYEFDAGVRVQEVGFVLSDCGRFGFSPDGWCPPGGLELKNPSPQQHVAWLLEGVVPDEHKAQIAGPLALCAEIEWWDFLSHCPGLPPLRVRTYRDGFTEKLKACLEAFWTNYEAALAAVQAAAGIQSPDSPTITPAPVTV